MKSRIRTNHTERERTAINRIAYMQKTFGGQLPGTSTRKEYYLWRCLENEALEYRRCQRVRYSKCYIVPDTDAYFVVSYKTFIGMYDKTSGIYYTMGAYSMTTYQHERKALEAISKRGYHIAKVDKLWLVDNFGN